MTAFMTEEVLSDMYDEVCRLIEDLGKNDEQITIPDLTKKVADFAAANEPEVYSLLYLKKKHAEEDFKGQIVINIYRWECSCCNVPFNSSKMFARLSE